MTTKRHSARSPRWLGRPSHYQAEAQREYATQRDTQILPWSWISTDCELDNCLDVECMTLHTAKAIHYAGGVCVYCGNPAGTKDHLLPRNITGNTWRHLVAVVPACADCNSRIGDRVEPNVAERRKIAQLSIERKYRHLLLRPVKTAADLRELGPALRSVAVKNNAKAEAVRLRLAWPPEPFYDLAAFQRSGIDDPVALGLCNPVSEPLRPQYARSEESA